MPENVLKNEKYWLFFFNRTSQRESTPPDLAIKPIKSFLNANYLNLWIFFKKNLYTFQERAKIEHFWLKKCCKMKNIDFFGKRIAQRESTSPEHAIKPIKSFLNANYLNFRNFWKKNPIHGAHPCFKPLVKNNSYSHQILCSRS